MRQITREIDYFLEFTYARLILGGMSIKNAKEKDYVDCHEAAKLWRRVSKNPRSYTPPNEICGAVWAAWNRNEILDEWQDQLSAYEGIPCINPGNNQCLVP